jgi:glycosyltransferase involved in cell wall biosynthesis
MTPRVTVLITAYGRQGYLLDAVRSVLDSPVNREAYEIVLATNQIDDELERSIRSLGVSVLRVDSRGGGEMTVAGIRAARGEVIAFMDDDDYFLPGKLPKILDVFEDPEVIWYRHGFQRVDENRNPLSPTARVRGEARMYRAPVSRADLGRIRRAGGFYNSTCHTVRHDALMERLNVFDQVTFSQDWAIPTLLSGEGKVIIDLTNILSEYRTHWSLDSHPFSGGQIPAAHLRKLRGVVREFYLLSRVAPSHGARAFTLCRAESYESLLWSTKRESIEDPRTSFSRSLRAIVGNLDEGDLFHATILMLLASISFSSRKLTESIYTALKRVEMRGKGLELPG